MRPGQEQAKRQKTQDYRYAYRGYHSEGGTCRVRIFEQEGSVPVIWIEHYERDPAERDAVGLEYSLVEFESWTPRPDGRGEPLICGSSTGLEKTIERDGGHHRARSEGD